ncbi:MAG: MarR family winged helix-turn-helix transcriptional regulator [Alphaproteobacteria bacterium]
MATLVSQGLAAIYAQRYGFGIPEWRVLATLGQFPSMTAKDIGAHSHMHKTKVSRAVSVLTRRKLVTRSANRADLREAFLRLTDEGHAVYRDLVPVALGYADDLNRALTQEEREVFDRLLDKLTVQARAMAQRAA